jgi:hypothetical protein
MQYTLANQKTIAVAKKQYYWPGMKKVVETFIAICIQCQQVKAIHQHPTSLLQPFPILEWKWEVIPINFITGLLKQLDKMTPQW